MRHLITLSTSCAFLLLASMAGPPQASAGVVPVNLSTWTQEGNPTDGNWVVQPGGNSVRQTINRNPTFFVSPDQFFNTTVEGSFKVDTSSDNDYIGFVFGYGSTNDFLLFDWKQANQGAGLEGFALSKINGSPSPTNFWNRTDDLPNYDSLVTDFGTTRGWDNFVEYDFKLLYTSNRIKIEIDDASNPGKFNNETIFDVTAASVGLTQFDSGRFGFYNYSQANVEYTSFTRQNLPPNTVPEPGITMLASAMMIGCSGFMTRRRRKNLSSSHSAS